MVYQRLILFCALLLSSLLGSAAVCAADEPGRHPDLPDPNFDFKTFFVTRPGLTDTAFEQYLTDARPEIVQVGYYGPMLHGYGDAPGATGYPMQLPAQGVGELLRIFSNVNAQVHNHGLKVVGHFQMGKVIGVWEDKSYFYDFYMNRWDEDLLGPRPHPDVLEIVQRDAAGLPLEQGRNATTTYVGLCLSSPHTRQMLKQMLKVAIDAGVDGVMSNFNYRWDCVCPYCQTSFREYLGERFDAETLAQRFGIADLATHKFEAIPASIPGYPEPDAPPLAWEAKRWGALQFKAAFDEILIDYGRSVKPDLIIATWNHIGDVGHREERAFLPIDLWGRGENYFWYSGGAAFVGDNIDLPAGKVGDAWLVAHYLRELGGGKPFVLGKYDRTRMRVNIAEAAATGGGGMGRYMRFLDPVGYEHLTRYTQFVHAHRDLYGSARPVGEVALVLPRQSVQAGMPEALDAFRDVGHALVRDQLLIDVVADQKLSAERLRPFAVTVVPDARALSDAQWQAIEAHARSGGKVVLLGQVGAYDEAGIARDRPLSDAIADLPNVREFAEFDAQQVVAEVVTAAGDGLSRIDAPWTLRASLFEQPDRLVLHLVNYKYDHEKLASLGRNPGPAGELPVAENNIVVDLRLPEARSVQQVLVHQPEQAEPTSLTFEQDGNRLRFTVDEVLVYAVLQIDFADAP